MQTNVRQQVEQIANQMIDMGIGYAKFDTEFLALYPITQICMNNQDIRVAVITLYFGHRFNPETGIIKLDGSELEQKSPALSTFLTIMVNKKIFTKIDSLCYKVSEKYIQYYTDVKLERKKELDKLVEKMMNDRK